MKKRERDRERREGGDGVVGGIGGESGEWRGAESGKENRERERVGRGMEV